RTGSEVEALLLENTLIKKHKPKYNIRLKDDKTYPYIRLDTKHEYPRPYVARRQSMSDGSEYYGPFPNGSAVWEVLKIAARVFKIRDCRDRDFANRSRPCLSFEVGQCTAPCVGKVTKDEYAEQVKEFRYFLKGHNEELEKKWDADMLAASEALEFERAAELRDRIKLMNDVLGDRQRMVDTTDHRDRDVWALWPEEFLSTSQVEASQDWEEGGALDAMVLQFRSGKLVGRTHWSADLSDALEGDDILANVLVQHYQKNPPPELIVIPPKILSVDRAELGHAIEAVAKAPAKGPLDKEQLMAVEFTQVAAESVSLVLADERPEFWSSFELAKDNVRGWHDEQRTQRLRQHDSLLKLQKFLSLPKLPVRMECLDISNFQGSANVASCVVFIHGKPSKDNYRHYTIKGFEGQNDFASMKELVTRRYLKPDSVLPDLLVVDGGKGQLSSVKTVLDAAGLSDMCVISLAKARTESNFESSEVASSEERVFLPGQKNYKQIRDASVLRLLTHIRDEAHRFAIEFNRKKMRERLFEE
ncbi:MAG: excinuclease ABC subunit UvrC, partial [Bdellovibrionota bacterium]